MRSLLNILKNSHFKLTYRAKIMIASSLLAIFCGSLFAIYSYSQKQDSMLFERDFFDFTQRVDFQFKEYTYVLSTFSAFINAQEDISLDEMNRYCDSIDFSVLQGIDVITFAKRVPQSQKESFSQLMRKYVPTFTIQSKLKTEYYPITFVYSPIDKTNPEILKLYGKDMSQRVDYFNKTIESGKIISSGQLITDLSKKEPGLPARLAIYSKDMPHSTPTERKQAVIGTLEVGFKLHSIINQVISHYLHEQMYIEIYNKTTKELLYRSDTNLRYKQGAMLSSSITFAQVPWEIRGYNKNNYMKQDYMLMFILITMSIITLFYVVYLVVERRTLSLEADIESEKIRKELIEEKNKLLQEEVSLKERFLKERAYFFAQITHELKTPLNAIMGYNELIKMKLQPNDPNREKLLDYISKSISAVNRLVDLINNILDISKMSENCMQYHKEEHNIMSIYLQHESELQVLCQNKHILLQHKILTEIPNLKLDKSRWIQVFNNLISNAVKFSPNQSIITVSMKADSKLLTIEIQDQGQGIPKGQEDKIFMAFMQSSINENDFKSGTGLGLPLVREILKAHHAIVSAKNNENGIGATFTIELDLTAK